ncbi:hypothetical protein BP5796_05372 [Coleophoma crateriformis]|uniref:Uncharacterized protein n=1 Tax=Coleophoma crateriformis TaxID=565419 RepID=A0A3D8S3M7_9HELO|nr:hypothetical protein BP5796_05372 [Coleophoma crateriformis]
MAPQPEARAMLPVFYHPRNISILVYEIVSSRQKGDGSGERLSKVDYAVNKEGNKTSGAIGISNLDLKMSSLLHQAIESDENVFVGHFKDLFEPFHKKEGPKRN